MSRNIDILKCLSEPNNILSQLYEESSINILTKEEFENLPLNENYLKRKQQNNNLDNNNNERSVVHKQN
jgi:hypothetical protein